MASTLGCGKRRRFKIWAHTCDFLSFSHSLGFWYGTGQVCLGPSERGPVKNLAGVWFHPHSATLRPESERSPVSNLFLFPAGHVIAVGTSLLNLNCQMELSHTHSSLTGGYYLEWFLDRSCNLYRTARAQNDSFENVYMGNLLYHISRLHRRVQRMIWIYMDIKKVSSSFLHKETKWLRE